MSHSPELPSDLAACQALIRQQQQELAESRQQLGESRKQLTQSQQELSESQRVLEGMAEAYTQLQQAHHELQEELKRRLRWIFGRRRERVRDTPGQLLLFELDEEPAADDQAAAEPTEPPEPPPSARQKSRRRRKADYSRLPTRRIEHTLTATERQCPGCQREMEQIGTDESMVLNYQPSVLERVIHVRPKCACRHCQQGVVTAAGPQRVIHRSIAGPELIAQLLVSKYSDHLPLYRLEDIFARHGVHLARSTLCDWVRGGAELLRPFAEFLKSRVLKSPLLWTDDTPVRVQDRTVHGGTRQGRFWAYLGDQDFPYTVYDYTEDRSREGPADFLKDYQGYVHADAYGGYDGIYLKSSGRVIEVACWAHARRKFFDARGAQPREALEFLEWIRQLYDLEDQAHEWSTERRQELRAREANPVLDRIERRLHELHLLTLPKSTLGKAVTYARNQWEALRRYTTDGRLTIDNNVSERTLRQQALGRKNWLFLGNDAAGERAAVLYTVMATAKRHRIEPWAYVTDLLLQLTDASPELEPLLPERWLAEHPDALLTHRLEESRNRQSRQKARRSRRRKR